MTVKTTLDKVFPLFEMSESDLLDFIRAAYIDFDATYMCNKARLSWRLKSLIGDCLDAWPYGRSATLETILNGPHNGTVPSRALREEWAITLALFNGQPKMAMWLLELYKAARKDDENMVVFAVNQIVIGSGTPSRVDFETQTLVIEKGEVSEMLAEVQEIYSAIKDELHYRKLKVKIVDNIQREQP